MEIGAGLATGAFREIPARGGLLLPGLHDHHLHVAATAAAASSIRCGPPDVADAAALVARLRRVGTGWLRGTGYHESVAGLIDRSWLDEVVPARPVRIQHRSGRMWFMNSAGLDTLLESGLPPPAGLERIGGSFTGRLFDEDAWLRRTLGSVPPSFGDVGAALAKCGVTGVTEMSPTNDAETARHFARERDGGRFPQRVVMAGRLDPGKAAWPDGITLGPVKLHLHEAELPGFDDCVALIRAAHDTGRPVAVHCVTLVELVFTLAAFGEAGAARGDRIEHASVAPDELLAQIAALGLAVVAQPNFVAERGDAYRADIPSEEWPLLYRLRSVLTAGIVLAGGTDSPFGAADPWAAMAAAVERRTAGGALLCAAEALSAEEALALFLADPVDLARSRTLDPGCPADLCLLDRPWSGVRQALSSDRVRTTIIAGVIVHDRVDQAPAERACSVDPPA